MNEYHFYDEVLDIIKDKISKATKDNNVRDEFFNVLTSLSGLFVETILMGNLTREMSHEIVDNSIGDIHKFMDKWFDKQEESK